MDEFELNPSKIHDEINLILENPLNTVILNALQSSELTKLVMNHKTIDNFDHTFSNKIDTHDIVASNQQKAGICWMCSGLSLLRRSLIEKYDLDRSFELSMNYLMFWDKLERCNYFLNYIVTNKHKKITSSKIQIMLSDPIDDGGTWHTFVNLVNKYGIVPNTIFKRRESSINTTNLNNLLSYKLREFASLVMSPNQQTSDIKTDIQINQLKTRFLSVIVRILVTLIGVPVYPDTVFDWSYVARGYKKTVPNLTPIKFCEEYCIDVNDYVLILNDPRLTKSYNKLYELTPHLSMINNNSQSHTILNLDFDDYVELIVKQIDSGKPVWLSCDIDKFANHKHNILDINMYNYGLPFQTSFNMMSKADRLDFYESYASHVLCIVGYDIETKKSEVNSSKKQKLDQILKFRAENSWGNIGNNNGFYTMTKEWLKEYGFEITINIKHLTDSQKDLLKTTPTKMSRNDRLNLKIS